MRIIYEELGGRFVCCRLDEVIIVDKKYQREFEKFMLTYKPVNPNRLISNFKIKIGG